MPQNFRSMADHGDPDEWELINDDGFVHKRKKRPRLDPAATSSVAQQPRDAAVERRHRRERKTRALVKLRDKYLKEIGRWELLSNMLKKMEQNARAQSLERQELYPATSFGEASSSHQHSASDSTRRQLVDGLLSQVKAQEAVIRDVSNLCDVAEALCSAYEDRLKQQLTDLPIWYFSPRDLMSVLAEQ